MVDGKHVHYVPEFSSGGSHWRGREDVFEQAAAMNGHSKACFHLLKVLTGMAGTSMLDAQLIISFWTVLYSVLMNSARIFDADTCTSPSLGPFGLFPAR